MEGNTEIDTTGADGLEEVRAHCAEAHVVLAVVRVKRGSDDLCGPWGRDRRGPGVSDACPPRWLPTRRGRRNTHPRSHALQLWLRPDPLLDREGLLGVGAEPPSLAGIHQAPGGLSEYRRDGLVEQLGER